MPGGPAEGQVTVVLRRPLRRVADVDDIDLRGVGMRQPEEGTALLGLAPAIDLDGIVRDCRAKVGTPGVFPVVAEGTGYSGKIYAAIENLDPQSVGEG